MNPCERCLVLPMCLPRFKEFQKQTESPASVIAFSEVYCTKLEKHFEMSNQSMVNSVRVTYGLSPLKQYLILYILIIEY